MIFTDNLSFFYVFAFIVVYNLAKVVTNNKLTHNILLLLGSVVVLTTLTDIVSLGIIIILSIGVFYTGKFLNRKKDNKVYLAAFVFTLIGLFVLKNYKIANFDLLQRIGLSYILFRMIGFLVESSKNTIKNYNIVSFVNYIIFFPTFIAGPIDEYNNFNFWISTRKIKYDSVLFQTGLFKLFIGIIKKFLLVPIIAVYATDFALFDVHFTWQVALVCSLLLYSAYILLDFSGYSDIAIGTAYLIGIKTPENFDNPYGAKSLSVFWKKWHMTFSNFLFKYVFKPVVVNFSKWLPNTKRLTVSLIGYLITFTICGIWHGPTLNFIYWGLWHGVFLYVYKLWDVYIFKKYLYNNTSILNQRLNAFGGVLVTFVVVTIGWFFFNYQTGEIAIIGNNIFRSNSTLVDVSTVENKKTPILKIQYLEDNQRELESVDIYLTAAKQSKVYSYMGIVPNAEDFSVYIMPPVVNKSLYEIKTAINYKNGDVLTTSDIGYLFSNKFSPSEVQEWLFGKNQTSTVVDLTEDQIIPSELYLGSDYDDGIELEPRFIDGYGWAIQVNYVANKEFKVQIEYKLEDGSWIVATNDRDGKYNFFHIHGKSTYKDTYRNLLAGTYEIRLRYVKKEIKSKWFNSSAKISDYDTH